MSREIRFRAWDKFTKKMWRWEDHNTFSTATGSIKQWFTDHDLIVMQYTGINDKNGVELCEGDIVMETFRYNEAKEGNRDLDFPEDTEWDKNGNMICRSVVEFERACYGLRDDDQFIPFSEIGIFQDRYELAEVIGNIYENPELENNK